jgi:DNA replication ATP-dependent helicase Dna2
VSIIVSDKPEYSAAMYKQLLTIALAQNLDASLAQNLDTLPAQNTDTLPAQNTDANRLQAMFALFRKVTDDLANEQKIALFTQFAKVSYVCFRFEISANLQRHIYEYRRLAYDIMFDRRPFQPIYLDLALYATAHFIAAIFKNEIPDALAALLPNDGFYTFNNIAVQTHFRTLRVVVLEDKPLENVFICTTEAFETTQNLRVHYKVAGRNDAMDDTISAIRRHLWQSKVVTLMLHQADITAEMAVYARLFVVEPDYLMEVTAVSECVQSDNKKPLTWLHLLKKFIVVPTTPAIMLGHIANFFLDNLIQERHAIETVDYDVFFKKTFKLNPLAFSLYTDSQIKEMYANGKIHFNNIKRMVAEGFAKEGIHLEDCYLEPTFYSAEYGIYGRLDVFHHSPKGIAASAIVELKSGKSFRPNVYGINNNNYTQTLLYDLLLKSVYQTGDEIGKYVLYSGSLDGQNLKYAGVTPQIQADAVQIRNQITNIDWLLCELTDKSALRNDTILDMLTQRIPPPGFIATDHKTFCGIFSNIDLLERMYFMGFTGFIAREHRLARIGNEGNETRNGMAGLWRTPLEEKINNFTIFFGVEIADFKLEKENYIVQLAVKPETPPTNFRIGDIGVLYAITDENSLPLHTQIFKCTVIALSQNAVTVRLRSAQINPTDFKKQGQLWNLEQDTMDSGFVQQYKNIFQFIQAPKSKRQLLFGLKPPAQPLNTPIPHYKDLTDEQSQLLEKALQSRDYFLLWGPPGSGKTSQMLRYYVQYLMENTNEKVLLLAFTNRAVEEICEAIASIEMVGNTHINDLYLRIGSSTGSNPHFASQFFEAKIKNCDTRLQLKTVIQQHRIIVSTVSGAMGKTELFELGATGDMQGFDRVVIDEASQLTEPMLVGLLPRFKHFMLIGDHRQLPAVVAQSEVESAVIVASSDPNTLPSDRTPSLHDIGLHDLRNSLFERLYLRCQTQNWAWAYAQLSKQGRMHADINAFPSKFFYDDNLEPFLDKQFAEKPANAPYKRLDFIDTLPDNTTFGNKTNLHEAEIIKNLIPVFYELYKDNFNENTIGIITPYRAQIAAIRNVLAADASLAHILPHITIDTVERYQGSARAVILISLCTNSVQQLANMVSTHVENGKNVDRKLNVALTRAREFLILVGNKNILQHDATYKELLQWIG